MSQDPIVITGIGLVTCLGLTAEETWQGVLAKRRAMGTMPALESPLPQGRTGGQAPDLPADFFPGRPREVRYLRWAIRDAFVRGVIKGRPHDAPPHPEPESIAVVLGTTLHGIRQGGHYLRTNDARTMEHFLAAPIIRDALQGLPIRGPLLTTCSACSSGLGAIALGITLLRSRQADLVLAGGYDPVSEYVYAGFDSLRLVAEGDALPFSKDRDGMKVAEGYAIVALEREPDARANKSKVLARIAGYGESSASHPLTQPPPEGEGAARAIRAALSSANLPPQAIGLISAHATATPNNDAAEFAGITKVFEGRAPTTPVVAFKSHVGHTLGAAGATELILSALALRTQTFPPTANTTQDSLEFPVHLNLADPRPTDVPATLNLSLGFGGSNAAMILRGTGLLPGAITPSTPSSSSPPHSQAPIKVLITGLGFLTPGHLGNDALRALASNPQSEIPNPQSPTPLNDDSIAHLLNARRTRRMSEYVKATLAATTIAFQDAGITDIPAWAGSASAILGTSLGSTNFCEQYYRPITKDGLSAANPALFAEGVPNAAAAQLSLLFQVKGGCQTILGSRTAGLDALWLAALRIASGEWDRAIVSAGEEFHDTAMDIYKSLGLNVPLSPGAVTFILESESLAGARSAKPWAAIDPARSANTHSGTPAGLARATQRLLQRFDPPATLITSTNGTWLDRVEYAAARRAYPTTPTTSLHPRLPDLASAAAPTNLAAALLNKTPGPLAILATDYAGAATTLRIVPTPRG